MRSDHRGWTVHPQVGVSALPNRPWHRTSRCLPDATSRASSAMVPCTTVPLLPGSETRSGKQCLRAWAGESSESGPRTGGPQAGALSKLDDALREAFENTPVETSEPRANEKRDDGIAPGAAVDDELEDGTDAATDGEPDRPDVETRALSDSTSSLTKHRRDAPPEAEATLSPYAAFEGSAGPDPRNSSAAEVAEGYVGSSMSRSPC